MIMQVNAQKIRNMRDQKCWSQQQLADMAGISLRTLQRVEASSVASQETIKSLASVFEVECEALFPAPAEPEAQLIAQAQTSDTPGQSGADVSAAPQPLSKPSADIAMHRKQFFITFAVLLAVYAFGLFSVFGALGEQRIDEDAFGFYKNLLSVAFLIGIIGNVVRAFRKGAISKSDFF